MCVNAGFFNISTGQPVPVKNPNAVKALLGFTVPGIGESSILMQPGKSVHLGTDTFTVDHHPRTLIAGDQRGRFWLAAIDGRQSGYSLGMSLADAVNFLKRLGAQWVINLDGGGSTTLVAKGRVENQPSWTLVKRGLSLVRTEFVLRSDKVVEHLERPVANARS